ncbi:hypothetical protein [Ekhidna sp.]|uniref:hypothetical protein n=1 Tax=Ekhidna sp. TaxID=2608089 RepID=UPI003516788C
MENIVKSLKAFLYDRSSNPFFANFLFAWLVYNWEIIYITLFVDAYEFEPLTKLQFIEREYINYYDNALWPFLGAIFLTMGMPWLLNKAIIPVYESYLNQRAALRLKARKEKPYSREKANELFEELNRSKTKYVDLLQELENEKRSNLTLQQQANEKVSQFNKLNNRFDEIRGELENVKRDLTLKKEEFEAALNQKRISDESLESLRGKYEDLESQFKYLQDVFNSNEAKQELVKIYKKQGTDTVELDVRIVDILDRAGLVNLRKSKSITIANTSPLGRDLVNLLFEVYK